MDINQYMGMFLEESREHLQTLNSCLLDLENNRHENSQKSVKTQTTIPNNNSLFLLNYSY